MSAQDGSGACQEVLIQQQMGRQWTHGIFAPRNAPETGSVGVGPKTDSPQAPLFSLSPQARPSVGMAAGRARLTWACFRAENAGLFDAVPRLFCCNQPRFSKEGACHRPAPLRALFDLMR